MLRSNALASSSFVVLVAVAAAGAIALTGCAKKPSTPDASEAEFTSARLKRPNVHVSDALAKACRIAVCDVARAPKFDFDDDALLPEDRAILAQIAHCVTTGPLKGQSLALVGRADPRGESEYNMILGEHRSGSVSQYLALLGVAPNAMTSSSRGELDAEGTDEDGWARDRRVDVALAGEANGDQAAGAHARASAP